MSSESTTQPLYFVGSEDNTQLTPQIPVMTYNCSTKASQCSYEDSLDRMLFNDDSQPIQLVLQNRLPTEPFNVVKNIKASIKTRHVTAETLDKEIPTLISLKADELNTEQLLSKEPIDLVCVIDVSGSMQGTKIQQLQKTLSILLEFLDRRDRLSIATFNENGNRLCPLLTVDQQNKMRLNQIIGGLKADGGTSITKGMDVAFKILKERRYRNSVSGIFLLTDGLDADAYEGVPNLYTRRAMQNIQFSLTCFGFGSDHDADLLTKIATLRNGQFYYIDCLNRVAESFAASLGSLLTVVAKDVVIRVENTSEGQFSIRKVYGNMWKKHSQTLYTITLPYLIAGTEKGFLMEVVLAKPFANKKQRMDLKVEIQMKNKDGAGTYLIKMNSKFNLGDLKQLHLDQMQQFEVVENHFRVRGAEAIQLVNQMCSQGRFRQAQVCLWRLIEEAEKSRWIRKENLKDMLEVLKKQEECCKRGCVSKDFIKTATQYSHGSYAQGSAVGKSSLTSTQIQQKFISMTSIN